MSDERGRDEGQFEPEVEGQFEPEVEGQFEPEVEGRLDPDDKLVLIPDGMYQARWSSPYFDRTVLS